MNLYPPGVWFVDIILFFPGVTFALFFVFVSFSFSSPSCFHGSRGPSLNRSLICMRPDSYTQLPNSCLRLFLFWFLSFFLSHWRYRFFRVILYLCRFLFVQRVRRTFFFPFRTVFFYFVATSWILYISLCDNSINQSVNQSLLLSSKASFG